MKNFSTINMRDAQTDSRTDAMLEAIAEWDALSEERRDEIAAEMDADYDADEISRREIDRLAHGNNDNARAPFSLQVSQRDYSAAYAAGLLF